MHRNKIGPEETKRKQPVRDVASSPPHFPPSSTLEKAPQSASVFSGSFLLPSARAFLTSGETKQKLTCSPCTFCRPHFPEQTEHLHIIAHHCTSLHLIPLWENQLGFQLIFQVSFATFAFHLAGFEIVLHHSLHFFEILSNRWDPKWDAIGPSGKIHGFGPRNSALLETSQVLHGLDTSLRLKIHDGLNPQLQLTSLSLSLKHDYTKIVRCEYIPSMDFKYLKGSW